MKLYLFTRNDDIDYGECIGAVIASTSLASAKKIMYGINIADETWECTLIAENAEPGVKEGVVLDSFSND